MKILSKVDLLVFCDIDYALFVKIKHIKDEKEKSRGYYKRGTFFTNHHPLPLKKQIRRMFSFYLLNVSKILMAIGGILLSKLGISLD